MSGDFYSNDEKFVRKIETIKVCKLCKPLDDECNNLIDIVEKLEQENKKLKKLVFDTPYKSMNYYELLKDIKG